MPDTEALLADWKAKTDTAERAPWKYPHRRYPGVVMTPRGCLWDPNTGQINDPADAEFIATARTAMPRLLTAVESVLRLCDARDNAPGRYAALAHTSDIRRAITDALSTESSNSGSEHA